MQIKKEEMRQKILEIATDEFLKRGYENASMRVIARKAHTTQGNVYHYFKNKEMLLEEILLPTIENIETMISQHIEYEKHHPITKKGATEYVQHLEEYFDESGLGCFLDKKVIILLKLQSSHFLERKENIIKLLHEHLQESFYLNDDVHYSEIVLNMLIECVKHVLIEHENIEDAKTEFLKFFRLMCIGLFGQLR